MLNTIYEAIIVICDPVSRALGTKERWCKMYTDILLSPTDFIHRDQNREGLLDIQIRIAYMYL